MLLQLASFFFLWQVYSFSVTHTQYQCQNQNMMMRFTNERKKHSIIIIIVVVLVVVCWFNQIIINKILILVGLFLCVQRILSIFFCFSWFELWWRLGFLFLLFDFWFSNTICVCVCMMVIKKPEFTTNNWISKHHQQPKKINRFP